MPTRICVGDGVRIEKPGSEEHGLTGIVSNVLTPIRGTVDWRRVACVDVDVEKTFRGRKYLEWCAFAPDQLVMIDPETLHKATATQQRYADERGGE